MRLITGSKTTAGPQRWPVSRKLAGPICAVCLTAVAVFWLGCQSRVEQGTSPPGDDRTVVDQPATVNTETGDAATGDAATGDTEDTSDTGHIEDIGDPVDEAGGRQSDLMDDAHRHHWRASEFGGQGEVTIDAQQLELDFGYPLTGVTYHGPLPRDQYTIEFEARRLDGNDFFGTITFPVQASHCSLVLGGWGGALVGLSSLDGEDASSNETRTIIGFADRQWYRVQVEVDWPRIRCWIDGDVVVDVDVTDREVDVRGDVLPTTPLGFSTFETRSQIRNVRLTERSPPVD